MSLKKLSDLKIGEASVIVDNISTGTIRRRLLDIGFAKDTYVECVGKSPLGDPRAYLVRGAIIALRADEASKIIIM